MNVLQSEFDTVIVGGGFGGLVAGASLAAQGADVALLEAHTITGGCAGFFDRFERKNRDEWLRYRFDVGATTLSGVLAGRPLDRLFRMLGSSPPLRRIDPGMICHLEDGTRIVRWSDLQRWVAECELLFGNGGQWDFWNLVLKTSDRGWNLSQHNPTFPPKSLVDLARMVHPLNLRNLSLLRHTRLSVHDLVARYAMRSNTRFHRFLDEQLMITAQNNAEDTPFLVGAMALAYPHETWYAEGGMSGIVGFVEGAFRKNGGEVRTKRRVTGIQREGKKWTIQTSRETYRARRVISNLTVWDMAQLMRGTNAEHFKGLSDRSAAGWGAVTLYTAVRDSFDDLGTLYHQIHCTSLPWLGATSIFVSLSPSDDRERAPEGWRTVTVSAHVADPKEWKRMAGQQPDGYTARKKELEGQILSLIGSVLPGFAQAERKFTLVGTPRTFEFFAGRSDGMVGGIPHSLSRNIFFAPKHRTPLPNFFMVGDTLYPGQGIPAVTLGALNLVDDIGRW